MPKITKTTFKTFIRKNDGNLHVKVQSAFDSMVDGCTYDPKATFKPAVPATHVEHTLGIEGVWLVGNSRDYFRPFEGDGFRGIEVSNSCGLFIVAVPEGQPCL